MPLQRIFGHRGPSRDDCRRRLAPLRELMTGAADLFFPARCRGCDGIPHGDGVLCADCQATIAWIHTACPCCGMAVARCGPDGRCAECRGRDFPLDGLVAVAHYEGLWRHLILEHKFRGDQQVLGFLAAALRQLYEGRLAERLGQEVREGWVPPVLCPLPAHPLRAWLRGRDPIRELVAQLGRGVGLRVCRVLRRRRYTRSQTALPRASRLRNQRRSFRARRGASGNTVVLVDDVVTTGATICEAARCLRAAGATRVYVLALGRAPSTPGRF